METHLSYPSLAYARSRIADHSWLAVLNTILDTCSLVMVGIEDVPTRHAQFTFALARRLAVDLSMVLGLQPSRPRADRLPAAEMALLRETLLAAGLRLREGDGADEKLAELRSLHEPYLCALADRLQMPLPLWTGSQDARDELPAA